MLYARVLSVCVLMDVCVMYVRVLLRLCVRLNVLLFVCGMHVCIYVFYVHVYMYV